MPSIAPPGGAVDWPATEGTLGIVGVAPWATLDFCRVLYRMIDAGKDWHYPRLLLDINTKLPSRGRHFQLGETDPSPAIAATIEELATQGATLAVVVSNTAHVLFERWAHAAPIPVLHIIEETIRFAIECGATHVAPLVSASLAEYDVYGQRASAAGLARARLTQAEQDTINQVIASVKVSSNVDAVRRQTVHGLLERLKGERVDTIIAGCTELSVLEPICAEVGLRFVDSNVALARAALLRLGLPEGLIRR